MTCREAQRLIAPYINGELTDEELEQFLEHVDGCRGCTEELEIYFMADAVVRSLDGDSDEDINDIQGALERSLGLSRQHVRILHVLRTARYAVGTLCFWSVLTVLILQFRIWGLIFV